MVVSQGEQHNAKLLRVRHYLFVKNNQTHHHLYSFDLYWANNHFWRRNYKSEVFLSQKNTAKLQGSFSSQNNVMTLQNQQHPHIFSTTTTAKLIQPSLTDEQQTENASYLPDYKDKRS